MGIPTPVPPSDEEKSALVERIIRGELTPEQAQERHGLTRAELKDWVRIYRREARRAFDDRVKSVLSTQGIDVGELAAAEFSGNVEDMSVAELLQTIQLGGKDAEIRIEQGRELSHIWCVGGQVVDAEAGELRGAGAVYRLLSIEVGRVHADFAPVERPHIIQVSTQALLMEGARRFDESRRLRAKLGDSKVVYVPSGRSLAPNVRATPDEFAVLRLFDGIRTIDEVVQISPHPDLETLASIQVLMESGLLERVRASRTSLRALVESDSVELPESSFLPMAQSLAQPHRKRPRRWVWGVAAVGSATLGAALALRLADRVAPAPIATAGTPIGTGSHPGAGPTASVPPPTSTSATTPAVSAAPPGCPEGSVLLGRKADGTAQLETLAPWMPFCMARTEVSVDEYERCRASGACEAVGREGDLPEARLSPELRLHAQQLYGSQCNAGQVGRERHPINCITFRQASTYCAANGGRLPTEAEWEFAVRGGEGRRYPWGNEPPAPNRLNACGLECKAWYGDARLDSVFDGVMYDGDDGFAGTAPVAAYAAGASPDGIYDLLGNVAEWTSTAVNFGQAQPVAPSAGTFVVRGGSFASGLDAERAPAVRLYLGAGAHGRGVGFRCAYDLKRGTRSPGVSR